MKPASLIATFFGSGLLPKAPGTWGSLAALPCGVALLWAVTRALTALALPKEPR